MTIRDVRSSLLPSTLLLVAAASGCTERAVNVGGRAASVVGDGALPPAPFYATAAPPNPEGGVDAGPGKLTKLVENDGQLDAFAADTGHVFWISSLARFEHPQSYGPSPPYVYAVYLRMCATIDCAGTLRSWSLLDDGGLRGNPNWLWVNENRMFWGASGGSAVSFCSREDCSSSGSLGLIPFDGQFAADLERAYFNGTIICDIADCMKTASRPEFGAPAGESPYAGGRYLVLDGDYIYVAAEDARILRARKDGTGDFQVVARNTSVGGMTVHDGYLYWLDESVGRVLRCDVAGCLGDPTVLVDGLSSPSDIAVDDENVYFKESRLTGPPANMPEATRILRSAVGGGSSPTVLVENSGPLGPIFIDADYVYYRGQTCLGGSPSTCAGYDTYIAAVHK